MSWRSALPASGASTPRTSTGRAVSETLALRAGLRIPQDLAVTGFDDIEDGRHATPSLTTIAPDKAAIAEQALQCLAERLTPAGAGRPTRRITVPHRLEVRESTDQTR
ncbi:substrate-binding domain-containing protein [Dactylosporangium sp. NPDC050688]|uniref:substrate-binding domain-containing protein n=1 Tax=Dactylosporangium sp. NPDC050688 TaxID=3157217 RepID=UPI0033C621AA